MVAYKDTILVEELTYSETTRIWFDGWQWASGAQIDDVYHAMIPNRDLHLIVSRGLNRW